MNVDMMRYIDRYVGIPLVFFLTICNAIISWFFPSSTKTPKRILFLELSEMGSAILCDPAMCKAKKVFDAELYFCIFSKNKPSLLLLNTVKEENIFVLRESNFLSLVFDSLYFLVWTRKNNIETVIDLELFSRCTALLTGLSGARNKVGFYPFHNEGLYRGEMLTHRVAYNPHIHIAKNFIALVNALISKEQEIPYSKTMINDSEIRLQKIESSQHQKDAMLSKIQEIIPSFSFEKKHLVLVNANASDLLPQRRWPKNKFIKLISMILTYDEHAFILLTGSPSEYDDLQKIVDSVNIERCVNFAGKVTFSELPILYSIATCMITNDSGPGHFSAVTDMLTFILFGPETPKLYGSLGNAVPIYANFACSPCVSAANHRKTSCKDNKCLQVISAKSVFEMVKPYLKTKAGEKTGLKK